MFGRLRRYRGGYRVAPTGAGCNGACCTGACGVGTCNGICCNGACCAGACCVGGCCNGACCVGGCCNGACCVGGCCNRRLLRRCLLQWRLLSPENPDQVRRHSIGAHRRDLDDVAHLQHLPVPEVHRDALRAFRTVEDQVAAARLLRQNLLADPVHLAGGARQLDPGAGVGVLHQARGVESDGVDTRALAASGATDTAAGP